MSSPAASRDSCKPTSENKGPHCSSPESNQEIYVDHLRKTLANSTLESLGMNSEYIIPYIKTMSASFGTCLAEIKVVVPTEITSPKEMKKWIFLFLKMVKRYKVVLIDGNPVFCNKGFTSFYEEIGHAYNHHRDVYEYYLKLPLCKQTHENFKREYNSMFYSTHYINSELFSKITYEISSSGFL
jgi:hypothetical protein